MTAGRGASSIAGSIDDPVFARAPRSELERRWAAVRQYMAERGLDAVVTVGFDDSLSGYVRWFCDFGASAYMKAVLFFADGPMATVEHGALDGVGERSPNDPNNPGVGKVYSTATFKSVAATFTYEADAVVTELKRRGVRRVGLIRKGGMPHAFVARLEEGLTGVEWSDETDALDRLKAVKSPVELASLRDACRIQDEVFAKVLEKVRPGVREVELLAFAEHEFRLRGAIDGTMASGSAPSGQSAGLRPWRSQNRILQQGDCFTILLEMSNDAGYYGELARQVVIGKPTQEHRGALKVIKEAQAATVSRFLPGASCAEIAAAHDKFMIGRGCEAEARLFSHSQGYDLVERPLVRRDETMSLEAGMFLSCHPVVATPTLFAFLCDNFIIKPDGPAERVHTTPQEIFQV